MDGDELQLFERGLRHAAASSTAGALDVALGELGWPEALETDPRTAVSVLFELQGAAHATSSALNRVVTRALGVDGWEPRTGVVLPALGGWAPPGMILGGRVAVSGLATAGFADHHATTALVVSTRADTTHGDTTRGDTTRGDTDVLATVSLGDLACRPVSGIDPELGLVEVTGDAPATEIRPVDWPAAVALRQLALGHELVGAARTMLGMARAHALDRIQFGRPIATFQAVRHRLADTLIAIETADAVLVAGWEDGSPQTAAMAKALAGRGARSAARHCQQVLAGIGFTTEHPLHHYIRRALVLDQLLGSALALTRALGDDLLRSRQLPPLLAL